MARMPLSDFVLATLLLASHQGGLLGVRATRPSRPEPIASPLPHCTGFSMFFGDGDCDPFNNSEECGYDGGDCCSCTCVDSDHYPCGEIAGFDCKDPAVSATCADESASYVPPSEYSYYMGYISEGEYANCHRAGGFVPYIADGYCDENNDIEACKFDGGDCCVCSCVDTDTFTCGNWNGFDCKDPLVSDKCRKDSAAFFPEDEYSYYMDYLSEDEFAGCNKAGGFIPWVGDGYCDAVNNNEDCKHDGGDCCACTCEDTESHECGEDGYDCQDPNVPSSCVRESAPPMPSLGLSHDTELMSMDGLWPEDIDPAKPAVGGKEAGDSVRGAHAPASPPRKERRSDKKMARSGKNRRLASRAEDFHVQRS